ncbi:hemK methyltransferase 1 [Megalopta genalis]|uniref:hemK methyltransferase 1 n=1 Tax=Megalopta genalis TaxID=115081 RepID=UPI0014432546|nr:MTRF1L release factor glutamine methyltransferase isoform X2 [Megalopta genalis]
MNIATMLHGCIWSARTFAEIAKITTRLHFTKTTKRITFCCWSRRLCTVNAQCSTIGEIIEQWSHRFSKEGVPEPVESIEHIVANVIGTKKIIDLVNVRNEKLTSDQCQKLESMCECRLSRMPIQYIIGEWDFRDITLKLVPPIFIPRPETEILVDFVLKRIDTLQRIEQKVLEVGCGSGAISLAIARANKTVTCIAVDANLQACELSVQNRNQLGLENQVLIAHAKLEDDGKMQYSNVLSGPKDLDLNLQIFDIIVSNPPYVPTNQISKLSPEIKIYEDLLAIDGGEDGLKVIKPLLKYAAEVLKPGGRVLLEVDSTHPEYIKFFTEKYSMLQLQYEHTYKDFYNNDRFVELSKIS